VEEVTAIQISGAAEAWQNLQQHIPFSAIHSEQQYEQALDALDALLDASGNDETHPLADMIETLGELIHVYEEEHYPMGGASGVDVIRLLMQEQGITQAPARDRQPGHRVRSIIRQARTKHPNGSPPE
jgi:HTH-type transcriptional regulator/antitoxin HigA